MVKQKLNSPLSQPCTFESQESLIPSFSVCCRLVLKPSRPSETPIFGWSQTLCLSCSIAESPNSGYPGKQSRNLVKTAHQPCILVEDQAKHIQVMQEWYFFFPKQIPSETQMKLLYPIFKIWLETSVSKIPSDFQKSHLNSWTWKLILWIFHLNLGSPNQLSMLTCKICRKHPCNIGHVTPFPAGIL